MKRLFDLHPKFIGILRPDSGEGISFDCPACGPSHQLAAYFSNPLDEKPVAEWQKITWERIGTEFGELTIKPSIQYPCFHGWIERGKVIDISESPLTVLGNVNGVIQPVSLSPLQILEIADQARAAFFPPERGAELPTTTELAHAMHEVSARNQLPWLAVQEELTGWAEIALKALACVQEGK